MIYQLENHIANQLKEFFNQFDFIDKVVVFGSRARHDCTPKSDIDLCIYSLEMTDIQFSKLKFEIDELPILYKLDVVHFEKVNKELQDNVERDGKLLFKNCLQFDEFFENIPAKKYQINKNEYQEFGKYPIIDQGQKFIVGYTNNKSKLFQIEKPIIIFGDHTRIIKYIDFDFVVGADGTKVLIPKNNKIDTKFAYYNLLNTNIENLGYSRHFKLLKEKSFYFPTLTKQKKIANILDKASELITLRKESIQKLDELSKSIFIDMFGDPVSNSKKWNLVTCIDSSSCIVPGRDKPKSFSGTIPWITTNDLIDKGFIDKSKNNIGLSQEEIRKSKAKIIPKNSVIFTCVGDLGIVSITKNNIVMNQQLHSFQCKENVNNCFLMYNISMQKDYMYKMASSTTLPYMNKTICNNIPLILPPITLQTKFATIIEKIEEQKALYEKELKLLENNFDSLLDESFN